MKRGQSALPPDGEGYPGADIAVMIVSVQLPLCDLDPLGSSAFVEDDEFALGYIFGVADMANYQFNRPSNDDQVSALNHIRQVFGETLGSDGENRFMQALLLQGEPPFQLGRRTGADDLGAWR